MKQQLMAVLSLIPHILSTYPALSAAMVNIGVIVAAYFGLHITGPELIYIVGIVTTLCGAIVHSNVTPLGPARSEALRRISRQPPPDAQLPVGRFENIS